MLFKKNRPSKIVIYSTHHNKNMIFVIIFSTYFSGQNFLLPQPMQIYSNYQEGPCQPPDIY
jgi:hypothetical protein